MSEPPQREEVSTRVTQALLDAVESQPWPIRPDWEASGLSEARLRGETTDWVSWEEYLALLRSLAGPGAPPDRLEALGAALMDHSSTQPFRHIAQFVGGAKQVYQATYGWVMNANIKVLLSTIEQLEPGLLEVRMELTSDATDGQVFFHSALGTMRRLPLIQGQPDAEVDADIGPRAARFRVRLATAIPRRGLLGRALARLQDPAGLRQAEAHLHASLEESLANLQQANQHLAQAEARWKALAENLPGVVAVIGPDGAIEALHGATQGAEGRLLGLVAAEEVAEEDSTEVAAAVATVLAGRGPAQIRVRTRNEDGSSSWWAGHLALMPGEGQRIIAVGVDITDRHEAELALRETEERLQRAQKREAISRLSGGLAHDINNILAAIEGWAELAEEAAEDDPATVRRAAESIHGLVDRASALTRRLLDSSRGPQNGEPTSVDLARTLRELAGMLERVIGEEISLRLDLADQPLPVPLTEDRLEQVVLNLVINARDAMPQGGTILVGTQVVGGGRCARLVVEDQGTGMSPEVAQRAMEPFFTTKPLGLGSGLGLPTVKDIVTAAGGTLSLESEPGRGTRVLVELPLRASDPEPHLQRPDSPAVAQPEGLTVLLAEDQADVRQMIEALLHRRGFRVLSADGGPRALELAATPGGPSIDLLLTDVVMPGMRGPELARALRDRLPRLPVLFMSGFLDENLDDVEVGGGPTGFLRKPFATDDLVEKLLGLASAEPSGR